MRIISGIFKGRVLKSPSKKDDVRPTTDRARETLFNILVNRYDLNNKTCIDLFCGTGSFGIEFISRGGKECNFVDLDIKTVRQNIMNLNIDEFCYIFRNDAIKYLASVKENKIDFAFADPPYKYDYYVKLLEAISRLPLVFILEHDNNFTVPDDYKERLFLYKKIGVSQFSFFDFN
jgi:16S rRNA (guanine966-N2)-methyltransferase